MGTFVNLRKTSTGWVFESEAALEDFVWENLRQIFDLIPLKRQFCVTGQYCDILAVTKNKQLVVLELKNVEDRYIVQQLTRYYQALVQEKPFSEEIDFSQPVRLLAITPTFHRDNFTDRQYHTLAFEFLQFAILQEGENFYLQLTDLDKAKTLQVEIPYQQQQVSDNIPIPPKALIKLLEKCTDDEREAILRVRKNILSFDHRMEEIIMAGSIKYGKGNSKSSKICAELCSDSKGFVILFLWLPLKNLASEKLGRARLWTDWNENALLEGYIATGIGAEITFRKKSIANLVDKLKDSSLKKTPIVNSPTVFTVNIQGVADVNIIRQYYKERSFICKALSLNKPVTREEMKLLEAVKGLKYLIENSPYKPLECFVNLALDKWLARL